MSVDPPPENPPSPAAPALAGPRRRRLAAFREPLFVVLLVVAVGLWLIWDHHPRKGLAAIALAFGGAAVARLMLSPRTAGLLVVRTRTIDVVLLAGLAAAVAALALVQNFPSPGG